MLGLIRDNPVLAKEWRSRLRARKQSRAARMSATLVVGAVILLLYYFGFQGISNTNSTSGARDLYMMLHLGIQMTLLLFTLPALASGAITQEREQQTWNALLLSRLSSAQIVVAKFVMAIFPAMVLWAIFAPLCGYAAIVSLMPFPVYLASNLHLLATAFFLTAISLFCSWLYKRTFIATSAAFGATAFLCIGTLLLYFLYEIGTSGYSRFEDFVPMWLNPYFPTTQLINYNGEPEYGPFWLAFAVYTQVGLLLLFITIKRLRGGHKELEQ